MHASESLHCRNLRMAHVLDDGVEAAGVEAGDEQRAAGNLRQGEQGAGVHGADVVLVAGQGHQQLHVARLQGHGLEAHAAYEGDLVFGEVAGHLFVELHDELRQDECQEPSRMRVGGNDRDGQRG
eukprot:255475_1